MSKIQIINAGWLIDDSAKPSRKKLQIRIVNGSIESVREIQPILTGPAPDNSDVESLDLNNATILPGLVDSHVHLTMSGTMDQAERLRQLNTMGFDRAEGVIQKHLDQHLAAGVLALRDGGDKGAHVLRFKRKHLRSHALSVQIKGAGRAWHQPGRYGQLIGRALDATTSLCQAIEQEKDPVDHVKIVIAHKNLDHQLEQLQSARQMGVPIALGTDAGSPAVDHGIAVVDEMKIFMDAGFSIEETVRCATFNGAQLLGIKDLGLLVPGMPATFIAVKGGPAGLPDSLRHLMGVWVAGERIG